MMEERRFPYGGVPVYNPLSLSKDEALAQFHARQAAYQSLMDLLREERPSHVLIIGTRGMGKTTLLQRVRYGVEDDAELNSRYLVLAFPEEQYNVNRLHRFLLNAVDALADAIERLDNKPMLNRVEKFIDDVGKRPPEEIEARVPQFLMEIGGQIKKNFLLLVDNADRLFEVIEGGQQWRLRDLLSSRPDLTFFGASTQASEGIYGPDRAFFEFFKIYNLAPLTFDEVRELLSRLSESVEEKHGEKGAAKRRVAEWLDADAARLRTLVQLTGGNPRTTVLLFHLVLDGLAGGAREYLEQLLDQVTPTYKGRVDELPAQSQQVLDAVALRWDPVIAAEIAEDTGLETSAVSTQMTRLVRQGILEKADPGDSKKALYQVAERFFNIWYLMRASRRVRAKLRWFVEFLRVFFDSGELERMAWARIERSKSAWRGHPEEIETAFAYVLASGASRERVEFQLRETCADMEREWRPYLDLLIGAIDSTARASSGGATAVTGGAHGGMKAPPAAALAAMERVIGLHPELLLPWAKIVQFLSGPPEKREAIEHALRRVIESEPDPAAYFAGLSELVKEACAAEPNSAWLWSLLAVLISICPGRQEEAEAACRRAIELDPSLTAPWAVLGRMLANAPARRSEAEEVLRRATVLDPSSATSWACLGAVLTDTQGPLAERETAFRKALEISPNMAHAWAGLAWVVAKTPMRLAEAETIARKAVELAPSLALAWATLGAVLTQVPDREEECEVAFRKALELEPNVAPMWEILGSIMSTNPTRSADAESALRRATDLDPAFVSAWDNLGALLARMPNRAAEAEVALRKSVELRSDNAQSLQNLGIFLYCETPREQEALEYIRLAHEVNSADSVAAAIFAAAVQASEMAHEPAPIPIGAASGADFWNELLGLSQNYAHFGKILLGICDLVQERDNSNRFVRLYRAVALAQLRDFPRASVALEDAIEGDPIDALSMGQAAIETFFAAAVRCERVAHCIELIDKKAWKDAWRPIYEALRAVEAGSAEYLKRIAVEIRTPALLILRRIAPQLPDLPARAG